MSRLDEAIRLWDYEVDAEASVLIEVGVAPYDAIVFILPQVELDVSA